MGNWQKSQQGQAASLVSYFTGGNQAWFADGVFGNGDMISFGGCGLIAMADVLLYQARKNKSLANTLPQVLALDKVTRASYQLFVEKLFYQYLTPWRHPFFKPEGYKSAASFVLGIQGWQFSRALKKYLQQGVDSTCQVNFKTYRFNQKNFTDLIIGQLEKDRPVPLLIGPTQEMFPVLLACLGRKAAVSLMKEPKSARTTSQVAFTKEASTASHWVTITSYYQDEVSQLEFLSVSSWGQSYRLNLTEFKSSLDLISGIIIMK